ncbi:hypothetical protein K457DRAFT_15016 [Linnemannia elongata AG-77]|uniref:Uncharacterized protein n=1 Tax=Linnemannia elongata AG-77 TaxID=1314771 RepID=A0A197K9F2_9FUNG|nr:hypothetical protein K457DRAFT_15016 [Linnemannia elongata AG-77]
MAPAPSTPSSTNATNEPSQDQTTQDNSQRRRPRFLRAITSPVSVNHGLKTTPTTSSTSSSSSSTLHASMDHTSPLSGSMAAASSASGNITFNAANNNATSSQDFASQEQLTRPSRPQLHPVQVDLQQNEGQLRSFSTSSVLPPFAVHPSNVPASQSRNSITETLKEHRWSKGLKLNWMSAFGSRTGTGLDGSLQTSSSISSSSRYSTVKR